MTREAPGVSALCPVDGYLLQIFRHQSKQILGSGEHLRHSAPKPPLQFPCKHLRFLTTTKCKQKKFQLRDNSLARVFAKVNLESCCCCVSPCLFSDRAGRTSARTSNVQAITVRVSCRLEMCVLAAKFLARFC